MRAENISIVVSQSPVSWGNGIFNYSLSDYSNSLTNQQY